MVCLGNICRSPLAEGILKSKIEESNLNIIVDSAGTSGYHAGQSPDPRSIDKALEYGIDISLQRARQFQSSDFNEFDIIYAMDRSNYSDVIALANSEEEMKKVKLILNESLRNKDQSVPDPYYGEEDGFENVYQLLDEACENIVTQLSK